MSGPMGADGRMAACTTESARTAGADRSAPVRFAWLRTTGWWPGRQRAQSAAEACEAAATMAERLAVLLGAGVAPSAAWRLIAEALREEPSGGETPRDGRRPIARVRGSASEGAVEVAFAQAGVASAAAAAAAGGAAVDEAIVAAVRETGARPTRQPRLRSLLGTGIADTRRSVPRGERSAYGTATARAWLALAAAWRVAVDAGSPLGATLRSLADALRDEAHLERAVASALAGPRASARMVAALPLVAVGFGVILGFDTIAVLTGSPVGLACGVAGVALLVAGARWNAALARAAARVPVWPGLESDLLAIAMLGGLPVDRARDLVRAALASTVPGAVGHASVDATIELSTRAGAPVAELLRADAGRLRREARAAGALRAETLAVRLLVPLGVCVLPAFVLLGVAPLMLSVVSGTVLEVS